MCGEAAEGGALGESRYLGERSLLETTKRPILKKSPHTHTRMIQQAPPPTMMI